MNKFILLFALIIFTKGVIIASDNSHSFYHSSTRNLKVEKSVFLYLKNPDYEAWSLPYNKISWGGGYSYGLIDYLYIGRNWKEKPFSLIIFLLEKTPPQKGLLPDYTLKVAIQKTITSSRWEFFLILTKINQLILNTILMASNMACI